MAEVSFGEWLKRRRGAEGWTREQLAQKIHCSISALRKFESEERRPSVEVVEQLMGVFSIPRQERASFLQFARGDWQAFADATNEKVPWRTSRLEPQSNLPSSITSFIGRKNEQDEVIQLLKKHRLVTLAGIGGIGKTRLAMEVGQRLLHDFPHGVWIVPLDSLADPLRVPQTVAALFDIREGADRPVMETLKNFLHRKTLLLILDNCEHLVDTCAGLIKTLLTHSPNLRILTTSRELLKVEGEATYYMPSLSIPETNIPSENVAEYESVQLFAERALLAQSTFQLTSENARIIGDICRRVDGIPLAIELTAARVNILSVEEILKQLNKSFFILESEHRTALSRHQTLQASMNWSWELLSEAEQLFLQQLSVCAGGWTLEAAQAVCDGDVLRLTNALVKKSLIIVDQQSGHETRYRFHEIVHQYAHQKLVESDEQKIRTRHLKYFSQLAEQAETALRGPEQAAWYTRLYDERDNIRAALEWADKTDVEVGLYICSRLYNFWEGLDMQEGARWLSEFIQKPESKAFPLARAKALIIYGRILGWMNQYVEARSAAEECLNLFRSLADRQGEIDALLLLGYIRWALDSAQDVELHEQALALAESLDDIWRQASALYQLGWNYRGDQQFAHWKKAIYLVRRTGDLRSLAEMLNTYGAFATLGGNLELAQEALDEVARLNDQLKDKETASDLLNNRARIAMMQGDYNLAHSLLQEGLHITEELGARMSSLWCRSLLGHLALREGNVNEARNIFLETARNFQRDQVVIGTVFNLEGIAGLYIAVGKSECCARLIGWADAARKKIGNPRPPLEQVDVDKIIAACLAKMGEAAFSDEYDEGQKMTLDEAVAYALHES